MLFVSYVKDNTTGILCDPSISSNFRLYGRRHRSTEIFEPGEAC